MVVITGGGLWMAPNCVGGRSLRRGGGRGWETGREGVRGQGKERGGEGEGEEVKR